MKKYWLLLIGIALIIVNIKIPIVEYPVFEPFETEAPLTVDLIINHDVGSHLHADIASDLVGLILIIIASLLFYSAGKAYDEIDTKQRRRRDRSNYFFMRLIPLSCVGIIFYLGEKLMPFFLNGNLRFRAEYPLYFVYLLIRMIIIVFSILGVTSLFERVENHAYNNVTILFGFLSAICFLIAEVVYFFDLMIGFYAYYLASILVMAYAIYRLIQNIKEYR